MSKFVCSIKRCGVEPNCLLILKRDGDGSCHTTKLKHTWWMYPKHYFVGNDKQPGIMGHNVDEDMMHI